MSRYIAIIHKDAGSDFGVSFPDFPGCVTVGSDLDEAADMAAEALSLHIQGMREDGLDIPAPLSLEMAREHDLARDAVAFLAVEAPENPRSVRVNITLPEDDLARIDAYAKRRGYTRSGLLVQGAKRLMREAG